MEASMEAVTQRCRPEGITVASVAANVSNTRLRPSNGMYHQKR